jgi:4-hydroxythreonine-4-phosphate dehydrogenase
MSLLFELMTPLAHKKISITTGDTDGIGLEVSIKALLKVGPQKNYYFFLQRSESADPKILKKLDKKFKRVVFSSTAEALSYLGVESRLPKNLLLDISNSTPPPLWVQESAELCKKKFLDAIVTAPMSKTLIQSCGLTDLGHTEILARVAGVKNVHMGFMGDKFNVVLATGHVPLKQASDHLTPENLKAVINQAMSFAVALKLHRKPIAILGLNPHAGERGLIGNEENSVISFAIKWAQSQNIKVEGPLVPDAAFFPENWRKYSCYVACYHDQGLIPFKMIHGQDSGCHVSLGLPFVRTSVDHGTAKDIYGKNRANPNSMISAVRFCIQLVRQNK